MALMVLKCIYKIFLSAQETRKIVLSRSKWLIYLETLSHNWSYMVIVHIIGMKLYSKSVTHLNVCFKLWGPKGK